MTDGSIFAPGFGLRPAPTPTPQPRPVTPPPQGGEAPMPQLRAWRVSQGLSQFEAAVRLGVSLSSWIRWETKHVPELRRAWLEEVCK